MSGLSDKYNSKLIAKEIWDMSHIPAVIVGVETPNDTQYILRVDWVLRMWVS